MSLEPNQAQEAPRADDNTAASATPKEEFSALDATFKTRRQVLDDFKSDLGFDPTDLNDLSSHVGTQEELSNEHISKLVELQGVMADMLVERFANNMAAFKKYLPDIYERFKDFKPSEPLEFICTSNGIPNLFFPDRNEFFYKTYNPVELCNAQVDLVLERSPFKQLKYSVDHEILGQIHHRYLNEIVRFQEEHVEPNPTPLLTNSCPICIVVGVGLGYHIGHLYERIEVGNMILIEPNADLFYASLHAFDWANLLTFISENHRGIYLMVGQTKEEVFEDMNAFYERHGRMFAGFLWNIVHYRSPEINEIVSRITEDYERTYATLGFYDDHLFAVSHGMNHIKNKTHFVSRLTELPEKWRCTPCCVVGNGPSLSHDLPFLRKVQDKVIIIACGTAIETLYNAGIKPTFYAATERLRIVSEHLSIIPDKDYLRDCIMIAGDVIHPEVPKFFDHHAIFGKTDETFYWHLACRLFREGVKITGISLMNPLVSNLGTVSSTALKFRNIYYFGVDNGTKREDQRTHPEENVFYKTRERHTNVNALNYTLDGNFGGKVASSYVYRLSANYMDVIMRSGKREGIRYYNCSDGAKLKEAEPMHSEDLTWWQELPDFDRDAFVDFMDNEKTFEVKCTPEEYDDLIDKHSFKLMIGRIMTMLNREQRPRTRLEYVFLLQSVCELINLYNQTRDRDLPKYIDGSLYGMFAMIFRALYQTKDEQKAIRLADDHLCYINAFLEDSMRLFDFVPDYCAEDHHVHMHGHIGYDHGSLKAPDFTPRKPYVTEEDRKNYPNQKFVKRYE